MRIVARVLIVFSLAAGALSASSAYLVPATDYNSLEGQTLAAPIGYYGARTVEVQTGIVAVSVSSRTDLSAGRKITKGDAASLVGKNVNEPVLAGDGEKANLSWVRVKEFSIVRWQYGWLFVLAVIGLVAGSLLSRRAARKRAAEGTSGIALSPEQSLEKAALTIKNTQTWLSSEPDSHRRCQIAFEAADDLQRHQLPAFLDAEDQIKSRLGAGAAAEVMDSFAGLERQINRAWSAASDGEDEEATACFAMAGEFLIETELRLAGRK